jgi:transposase-like protein
MVALATLRQIRIEDFAEARGISISSVKRWLYSFRERIPMTISGGLAVVDEHFDFLTLH